MLWWGRSHPSGFISMTSIARFMAQNEDLHVVDWLICIALSIVLIPLIMNNYHLFFIGISNDPFIFILVFSQAYIAKVMRKRKRANLSGAEKIRVEKSKHKIRINLWIISVAFLFLFTAFHGLQNLQTTVNGQMGADSLW